jgi:hypothetical protein
VDVSFEWSSSQAAADTTSFSVLPAPGLLDQISGILPWTHFPRTSPTYSLPAGAHTLVWEHKNNTYVLGGEERSRVDHLVLSYPELALALDVPPPGTVSSFGFDRWYLDTVVTDAFDGVDCAKSGPLPDSASASMELSVTGPGTLHWQWKVSALDGDFLSVSIDGGAILQQIPIILGTPADVYAPASLVIPAGEHVVRWTYKKDEVPAMPTDPVVEDAGFVDAVSFTP